MIPPNLKELFGDRYRITYDEAAEGRNDPWMMQIPCYASRLCIYPHGEGMLAIECDRRPIIGKRLAALGLGLVQDGDQERTFVFPVERFEEVASIVQPRRVLTREQREARAEHLKSFRFPAVESAVSPESASARSKVALSATEKD